MRPWQAPRAAASWSLMRSPEVRARHPPVRWRALCRFGWYGFNPGSWLAISGNSAATIVARTAVTTTLAGAAGGCATLITAFVLTRQWELTTVSCARPALTRCFFIPETPGIHRRRSSGGCPAGSSYISTEGPLEWKMPLDHPQLMPPTTRRNACAGLQRCPGRPCGRHGRLCAGGALGGHHHRRVWSLGACMELHSHGPSQPPLLQGQNDMARRRHAGVDHPDGGGAVGRPQVCYGAEVVLLRLRIDDVVSAFPLHGAAGAHERVRRGRVLRTAASAHDMVPWIACRPFKAAAASAERTQRSTTRQQSASRLPSANVL